MSLYSIVRPLLFSLPAETAHNLAVRMLRSPLGALITRDHSAAYTGEALNVAGLQFPNPVGLAAGLDKNAGIFNEMGDMGFGFVEIGTVTPRPQAGNPKPRLFRLVKDRALINRMGFNNDGCNKVVERLRKRRTKAVLGGNIGKNKSTPNDKAVDDYLYCFERMFDHVDYFTVNVSSPNTPDLRELQNRDHLNQLLDAIQEQNHRQSKPKPVFLKISPDVNEGQLDDIIDLVGTCGISGLIATNTTVSRKNLYTSPGRVERIGAGGLSGSPLSEPSTTVIRYITRKSNGKFPVIASGGVMTPDDAVTKIRAGASLVQVYTGFIYRGPRLVRELLEAISAVAD